jgi:hypothetical protein
MFEMKGGDEQLKQKNDKNCIYTRTHSPWQQ